MRICIVGHSDIIEQTLTSFLLDLGHDVTSVTSSDMQHTPELQTDPIQLAIILQYHERSLLQEFHRKHPETMIILIEGGMDMLTIDEALNYGVYAFLHLPIRFSELEVLLVRLAQYSHQTGKFS